MGVCVLFLIRHSQCGAFCACVRTCAVDPNSSICTCGVRNDLTKTHHHNHRCQQQHRTTAVASTHRTHAPGPTTTREQSRAVQIDSSPDNFAQCKKCRACLRTLMYSETLAHNPGASGPSGGEHAHGCLCACVGKSIKSPHVYAVYRVHLYASIHTCGKGRVFARVYVLLNQNACKLRFATTYFKNTLILFIRIIVCVHEL